MLCLLTIGICSLGIWSQLTGPWRQQTYTSSTTNLKLSQKSFQDLISVSFLERVMWHPPPILEYYCRIYWIWQQSKVSWVVKCLMNNFVCVLSSDGSVYLKECFATCVALYLMQWQQSLQIRWRTFPHFVHLENMLPNNLNKICVLLTFPISVLLASSHFISGGISLDFIWEERKLKNLWIQVESLPHVLVCLYKEPLL